MNLLVSNMTVGSETESAPLLEASAVKAEVDWTKEDAVSKVGGQGGCGDCYIWSAIGAIEGRCQVKNQGAVDRLSIDQVKHDLSRACKGGSMGRVFKHVQKKKGVCLWNEYKTNKNVCTRHGAIHSFHQVKPRTESKLKAAVSSGPVSMGIQAA